MNLDFGFICSRVTESLRERARAVSNPAPKPAKGGKALMAQVVSTPVRLRAASILPNGEPPFGVPHMTKWSTTLLPSYPAR
jgi:hypothetical protein